MNQMKKGFDVVKNSVKGFVNEEEGVGVVEIILILVVLVGLVILFKDKITKIVESALGKVSSKASSVTIGSN